MISKKVEEIAVIFAGARIQKDGSIGRKDILRCFEMAEDFVRYKEWQRMEKEHYEEVQACEKARTCSCGHKLKNGERIYDHGWEVGFECSNCH